MTSPLGSRLPFGVKDVWGQAGAILTEPGNSSNKLLDFNYVQMGGGQYAPTNFFDFHAAKSR